MRKACNEEKSPIHSRIYVPSLGGEELIATVFAPIVRDGAAIVEVGIRIQKVLKALKNYDSEYQKSCDFYADFTNEHFNLTLKTQFEKDLLSQVCKLNE
jgi:uncharacterized membrane protein